MPILKFPETLAIPGRVIQLPLNILPQGLLIRDGRSVLNPATFQVSVNADGPGSGKTTATQLLATRLAQRNLSVGHAVEDPGANPMLGLSYKSSESQVHRNRWLSHSWFYDNKKVQLKQAIDSGMEVFVQDVGIEYDMMITIASLIANMLSPEYFVHLYQLYEKIILVHELRLPDLIVYLDLGDDQTVMQRAKLSQEGNENFDRDRDFLFILAALNRWLTDQLKGCEEGEVDMQGEVSEYREAYTNVKVFDAKTHNFATDAESQRLLVGSVHDEYLKFRKDHPFQPKKKRNPDNRFAFSSP